MGCILNENSQHTNIRNLENPNLTSLSTDRTNTLLNLSSVSFLSNKFQEKKEILIGADTSNC